MSKSPGTKPRLIRGLTDDEWEAYRLACLALHGTDNRSEVIRDHVRQTIAEWRQTPHT